MSEGHHVATILKNLLEMFFPGIDFLTLGPVLFENVYSFLKTNGHSDPRSTATEIISDVAWKMSKMVVRGEEITLPKGWLFTCCRRRAIDELRKGDLLEPVETEVLDQIFTGQQVFSAQFVDYSRAKLYIQAALVELPPKQRAVVWLDQIECLRKEEIMKRLDIEGANHYRALKSKALRALHREVSAIADPLALERRLQELAKKSEEDE